MVQSDTAAQPSAQGEGAGAGGAEQRAVSLGLHLLTEQVDARFTEAYFKGGDNNVWKEAWPGLEHSENEYLLETNEANVAPGGGVIITRLYRFYSESGIKHTGRCINDFTAGGPGERLRRALRGVRRRARPGEQRLGARAGAAHHNRGATQGTAHSTPSLMVLVPVALDLVKRASRLHTGRLWSNHPE